MHIERRPRKNDASASPVLRAGHAGMRVQPSAAPNPLAAGLDFMLLLSELRRPRRVGDADPADLYGDFA